MKQIIFFFQITSDTFQNNFSYSIKFICRVIFNKIVDKTLLNDIIGHIEDPVIRQFFKSVKYLSKSYYPVQHEDIVINVMNKEFDHLLEVQRKYPPHIKRIGLALFPYLYELSYFAAPNLNKFELVHL